jgi:hypothetical protein
MVKEELIDGVRCFLRKPYIPIYSVMPDFMSGIHDLKSIFISTKSWMAGTSPAMTAGAMARVSNRKRMPQGCG